jgi:hypothetical protein
VITPTPIQPTVTPQLPKKGNAQNNTPAPASKNPTDTKNSVNGNSTGTQAAGQTPKEWANCTHKGYDKKFRFACLDEDDRLASLLSRAEKKEKVLEAQEPSKLMLAFRKAGITFKIIIIIGIVIVLLLLWNLGRVWFDKPILTTSISNWFRSRGEKSQTRFIERVRENVILKQPEPLIQTNKSTINIMAPPKKQDPAVLTKIVEEAIREINKKFPGSKARPSEAMESGCFIPIAVSCMTKDANEYRIKLTQIPQVRAVVTELQNDGGPIQPFMVTCGCHEARYKKIVSKLWEAEKTKKLKVAAGS